jgi:hypothetical protein
MKKTAVNFLGKVVERNIEYITEEELSLFCPSLLRHD